MTREDEAKSYLDVMGYTEAAKERVYYDAVVTLMLAFADAEAAAMRERAAGVADAIADIARTNGSENVANGASCVAEAIRALPATGEVGRE